MEIRVKILVQRLEAWLLARLGSEGRIPLDVERILVGLAAVVFGAGVVGAVGAALGLFRVLAVPVLALVFTAVAGLVALAARRRLASRLDRFDWIALGVAALAALSAGLLHHEYAQGQMDIGFYTNDAYVTAQTGGRDLHGPDDHLLPGFAPTGDGSVRAVIMFGYSSLAAYFALLGGYWAVPWVNAPLAFLTNLALYVVGRRLAGPYGALASLLFYNLLFPTLWHSRWVMTENAAACVFWVSAVVVLDLWKSWNPFRFLVLLLASAFGALARPEGFLVSGFALLVVAARRWRTLFSRARTWITKPEGRPVRIGAVLLLGLALVGAAGAIASKLPYAYLQAGWENASSLLSGRAAADASDVPTTGPGPNWGDYALRYEWDSSVRYGLHWFLLAGIVGWALGAVDRRKTAIVALLALPYAVFVLMPPVTTFHPWFMRRLWIALVPLVVAAGASTIARLAVEARDALPRRVGRAKGAAGTFGAAAWAALITLLLVVADASQPFFFEREEDDSQGVTRWLLDNVPEGGCLLADQDVVGYGIPLRFLGDRRVVGYFSDLGGSLLQSLATSDEAGPCRLLRLNTTLPVSLLGTDAEGAASTADYPLSIHVPPRTNLRTYLQYPPLADGYAPLANYLDEQVPPPGMMSVNVRLALLELVGPAFLAKGVELSTDDWERTPAGLEARRPNATVTIRLGDFSDVALNRTGLSLYLAYPVEAPVAAFTVPGVGVLARSDGSVSRAGAVEMQVHHLPAPVTSDRLVLPEGAVLRGVLVA